MVKMGSLTACATCAMLTAGKSNQSVAGMTHPLAEVGSILNTSI